ncbi:putative lipid II flippase FtsW [bacterium]|nr:putative lipid II flippase FtsW [bacterium]
MNRDLPYFRTLNTPLLLFILSMALVAVGIMGVYSASQKTSFLISHVEYASAGLLLMMVFYNVDYNKLKRIAPWLMLAALVLLLLIYVPGIGVTRNFSRRWIGIGTKTIQPSELAKLAMIIYMAKMMDDRRQYIKSFCSGVMPALVITGLFALVIVREPDLGAALVLCMIIFGMWLAGEMRWFHLLGLVTTGTVAALMGILVKRDYHHERSSAFLTYVFNPEAVDKSMLQHQLYQLHQSLIAVGSGGWWGLGLGESRQKFSYLPEAHTDYIFAILSEELGFVRMSLIVLVYALIVLIGWRVAMRSTDYFGGLLASGITLMIFINSAINMGVVLGLLPAKGLTLPFISFGGTSLLVTMAAMGILMNVASTQYAHQNHGRGGRR